MEPLWILSHVSHASLGCTVCTRLRRMRRFTRNPVCGTKFALFGPIHHHDDARIGAFSMATESVVPLSVPYPKDTEGKKTVLTEDTRTRTSTSSSLTTGFVDVLELEHVG